MDIKEVEYLGCQNDIPGMAFIGGISAGPDISPLNRSNPVGPILFSVGNLSYSLPAPPASLRTEADSLLLACPLESPLPAVTTEKLEAGVPDLNRLAVIYPGEPGGIPVGPPHLLVSVSPPRRRQHETYATPFRTFQIFSGSAFSTGFRLKSRFLTATLAEAPAQR
jgi:hypothetical protein